MNPLGMIAVAGVLIAVIGIGHFGPSARPLAWGLAICVGVLVHWVNSLQKQVDALRGSPKSSERHEN